MAIKNLYENYIIKKSGNSEKLDNILYYDETLLLLHFDNNVNKEGCMKDDFRLTDGSYDFNSDSKFGTKSVANYHYNMTFYSNKAYTQRIDLGCYDKTLEIWFKPINASYSCTLGLSNGNWSDERYIKLSYNENCFISHTSNQTDIKVNFNASKFIYNEWNHVAITYEKSNNQLIMKLWINGNKCGTATFALMPFVERFWFNTSNSNTNTNLALADECVLHGYIRYTKNFVPNDEPYIIQKKVIPGTLTYAGYDMCNNRWNRAKFCIYTNGDIVCCTQAGSYSYQSQFDISRDRGKTWTVVTTVAGNNISSGGDPSGLMLGFNSQKTPIYGFSRDHNHGSCQFVTENLQTQLANVRGGSSSWIQTMNWIWNEKKASGGDFYFGNGGRTYVNLDNFTAQGTPNNAWLYCRYADIDTPIYYYNNNGNLYLSSSPTSSFSNSGITLPNGTTNFITLQSFKGILLAIYKTAIYYLDKNNAWQQCVINGVNLNNENIKGDYLDTYHTNQVFSAALNVSNRCEFIYTFDGKYFEYMDCTDYLPSFSGVPIITAGTFNSLFVDFAMQCDGCNLVIHTNARKTDSTLTFHTTSENDIVTTYLDGSIIGTKTGLECVFNVCKNDNITYICKVCGYKPITGTVTVTKTNTQVNLTSDNVNLQLRTQENTTMSLWYNNSMIVKKSNTMLLSYDVVRNDEITYKALFSNNVEASNNIICNENKIINITTPITYNVIVDLSNYNIPEDYHRISMPFVFLALDNENGVVLNNSYFYPEEKYDDETNTYYINPNSMIKTYEVAEGQSVYYDIKLYGYKHYINTILVDNDITIQPDPEICSLTFTGCGYYRTYLQYTIEGSNETIYVDVYDDKYLQPNYIIKNDIVHYYGEYEYNDQETGMPEYIEFNNTIVMNENKTIYVGPDIVTLNILSNVENSIVSVLKYEYADYMVQTGTNTIFDVYSYVPVTYKVSAPGYLTNTNNIIIHENTTININLVEAEEIWSLEYPYNNISIDYINQILSNGNGAWEISNEYNAIVNSNNVNSYTYFTFTTPNEANEYILSVRGKVDCANFYGQGGVCCTDAIYKPSWDDMYQHSWNGTAEKYVFVQSKANTIIETYEKVLQPNTTYYIDFAYAKYNGFYPDYESPVNKLVVESIKLLTEKQSEIPSYLEEINYIISDGSQYIDTGISAPDGFTAEVKCYIPTQRQQLSILWAEDQQDPKTGLYNSQGIRVSGSRLQLGQSDLKTLMPIPFNVSMNIEFSTIKSDSTLGYIQVTNESGEVVRRVDASQPVGSSTVFSSNNLYLFATNAGGTPKDFIVGLKIHSVKMWNTNNNLVRDFIAVYNTNTGKYGLYDKVSRTFFGNLGSGEDFNNSDDINDCIPVDYIQATGTQYIDTGVYPTRSTRIRARFQYEQQNGGTFIGYYNQDEVDPEADSFRIFAWFGDLYYDYGSGVGYNRLYASNVINTNDIYYMEFGNRYVKDLNTDNYIIQDNSVTFSQKTSTIKLFDSSDYGKIYDLLINNGSTINSRSFKPIYNTKTKKYKLYDSLNRKFYGNKGTGDFLGGFILDRINSDYTIVGDGLYLNGNCDLTGFGTRENPSYLTTTSVDFRGTTDNNKIYFTVADNNPRTIISQGYGSNFNCYQGYFRWCNNNTNNTNLWSGIQSNVKYRLEFSTTSSTVTYALYEDASDTLLTSGTLSNFFDSGTVYVGVKYFSWSGYTYHDLMSIIHKETLINGVQLIDYN